MATVVEDTIKGTRARFTKKGFTYDRSFHVDGLVGDKNQMMFEAAAATGIPRLNSLHPANGVMLCISIDPTLTGDRSAQVTCHYESIKGTDPEEPSEPSAIIELGGTLQQITTVRDKDDNQILVDYTPAGGVKTTQAVEVSVRRPLRTKSWTITFQFNPDEMGAKYLGHVNSVPWKVDKAAGAAPRQWLCTEFSSRSDDHGLTWPTTISFEKNDLPPFNNWDEDAWWIDVVTGRLPTDPVPVLGNGLKQVRVYPEADFNKLNLKA